MIAENWLPEHKKAAICFTIDDLHPASLSKHGYDAGGDCNNGVFAHIDWLLKRHPQLKVTFFCTADWREISPTPTRKILSKIPVIRDFFYLTKIQPKSTLQLDKYPHFVDFYSNHKQVEIAFHGLHHVHKGIKIPVEFQEETFNVINKKIIKMIDIFKQSKIKFVYGFTPPAWNAPENLMKSLVANGVKFLASARDVKTEISKTATNNMSGRKNVSIVYPELIENGKMVHFASNFQATNAYERAFEIIENNGLVAIKAHIIKEFHGHISLDGVDENYIQYLDKLLFEIEAKYGDQIWWTTMGEMSNKILEKTA